jgi:hypothetical protein
MRGGRAKHDLSVRDVMWNYIMYEDILNLCLRGGRAAA